MATKRTWKYENRYRVTLVVDYASAPNFGDMEHLVDGLGEKPEIINFNIQQHTIKVDIETGDEV